jgi:hypothetical protein
MHTNFGGKYDRKRQFENLSIEGRIIEIVSLRYKMGGCRLD